MAGSETLRPGSRNWNDVNPARWAIRFNTEGIQGMLTGKQIREARALLTLQRSKFAEKAGVPHAILKLAEMTEGECPITIARAHKIRRAIEAAGIELFDEAGATGARRRSSPLA